MKREPELLLWLDLETTGSDKVLDEIIEIGAALTTPDLSLITDTFSRVILCSTDTAYERLMTNKVVNEMHDRNGLLDDLQDLKDTTPNYKIDQAQIDIMKWLDKYGARKHRIMLAGSGVSHFDRRFIERQMPLLDAMLMYPSIDVGHIRRLAHLSGFKHSINERKTHRALDDALVHLDEGRMWKDFFSTLVF